MTEPDWMNMPLTQEEAADLKRTYGTAARSISSECNVPPEHFLDLCDALDIAASTLEEARQRQGLMRSIRSRTRKKAAKRLEHHASKLLAELKACDGYTRSAIADRFFDDTKLIADKKFRFGAGTITIEEQPIVPFMGIVGAIANAAKIAPKIASGPRGAPQTDFALKEFLYVLAEFWKGTLKRDFKEYFMEIRPNPRFASIRDAGPENDASRFCVLAAKYLVRPEPTGQQVRYAMREVIKAMKKRHKRSR